MLCPTSMVHFKSPTVRRGMSTGCGVPHQGGLLPPPPLPPSPVAVVVAVAAAHAAGLLPPPVH